MNLAAKLLLETKNCPFWRGASCKEVQYVRSSVRNCLFVLFLQTFAGVYNTSRAQSMADTVIVLRRPFCWLKVCQLLCGLICFALYFHYRGSIFRAIICDTLSSDEAAFVRSTFSATTVIGYPFVIVLSILISLGISGTSLETSVLCFLLNCIGFGMYLIVGSIVAHCSSKYYMHDEVKGFAAMTLITSFLFLADVVIAVLQRYRK